MTRLPAFVKHLPIGAAALAVVIGSCKGPTGPNGADAMLADSLPPVIEWVLPLPGEVVDSVLTLSVRATDDVGVWRLSFFVAGFEYSDVSYDSLAGTYEYHWPAYYFPAAEYPVVARAWDAARNSAGTPVRIVVVEHP